MGSISTRSIRWALMVALVSLAACGGEAVIESESLVGADETASITSELTGSLLVGSTLQATASVNLRSGPSTSYGVLVVIPSGAKVTVAQAAPSNSFYKLTYSGKTGWGHGNYFNLVSTPSGSVSGSLPVGSVLKATSGVNLRSGPATSYGVLKVVATGATVTTVLAAPSSGYYKVNSAGTIGWSYGTYYTLVSTGSTTTPPATPTARDNAITRAKAGVGFSYWWGHARWLASGPTSSTKGSCTGDCPSCTHGGSYGADCSGYVAKIWQVPSTNSDLSVDRHPYSTYHFTNETHGWHSVARSSLKKADALTYNSDGSGHIMLFESGDGWGSMWAYEAKGCASGIVRNLRTVASNYKGIAHDNW